MNRPLPNTIRTKSFYGSTAPSSRNNKSKQQHNNNNAPLPLRRPTTSPANHSSPSKNNDEYNKHDKKRKTSQAAAATTNKVVVRRHRNNHDHRRPYRIFTVAILFVITSLRRIVYKGNNLEFFTSLLDVDTVASSSSSSSTLKNSNHNGKKTYAAAEDSDLVIFYNLYIPPDKDDDGGVKNAIRVIEDQMGQISEELYLMEGGGVTNDTKSSNNNHQSNKGEKSEKSAVIFYNLIGNQHAFPSANMTSLCRTLHPRMTCELLAYYPHAGESVTLADVHDYCHAPFVVAKDATANNSTQTTTRVVYLHSKGSYHSQKENHIWRKQMTSASLHPQCLHPPDPQCDVCSAQFYIKYAIMFPGNMWAAKCSYIRTLLPPTDEEFYQKKRGSIKEFLLLQLWGVLSATLDTSNVEHFGLGRYAYEHWIASSPHIKPCEMHTTDVGPLILLGKDLQGRKFGPEYYDWGMAPRRIKSNLGGLRQPRLRLERNEERQFREYYFLPGNLLKWFHLYGSDGVPPPDSWVWQDFPAGERWKELVGQYGEHAVDEMVKQSNPKFHTAFASDDKKASEIYATTFFDEDILSGPNPPVVVFYQMSFPSGNEEKAMEIVKAQFEVLSMGQYDNATNTFDRSQKMLLYYTIAGGRSQDADSVANLCKDKSDMIICHNLGKFDSEGAYGEIFHPLRSFCNAKPTSVVIHITNRLQEYAHLKMDQFTLKIQEVTAAVTSKMCRLASSSSEESSSSCNVCGTEFYPLPFFHFTGNMFSASCDYVKDLMPPSMFERTMNDIAGDALLLQLEEVFTTKLIRFDTRILGSHQHSVEHWIGAHPNLKPCDVAPIGGETQSDETLSNQMKLYSMAIAPRRGSAPAAYLTDGQDVSELKRRLIRSLALREYYYLGGNVFRWDRLYGKVPNDDSWVWSWFPDGQLWEAAARTSGEKAVNELTKQFIVEEP
mmetsp:Transcript_44937/g.94287  ORF Transcript_44937/g.94287 Transcript_44937/m.94287 type:complete len:944 (+) Transcript_44937:218-3049(+)|eukprot:CAMPEP_0183721850 /NCGR_PEP_ID=MMETSP0737-20130205/13986_1 /TAXON_ID=385413 /ORGANISM="Thalassiosira miniscula, Strain CCMP1093" /LENGTH=943 /DNA_ID=CAMNT_0025951913 /DNA_START=184 /DNA_END=3015 /DNA_ORIENTATION=-